MDADRIVAAGAAALDGPEAPAALGWLGRGPDDPVSLRRAWRTHRQSGKAHDKRVNHWLRGPDNFCRNRFCSQKRHQPATLIRDWLLFQVAHERPTMLAKKVPVPWPALGTGTFFPVNNGMFLSNLKKGARPRYSTNGQSQT